MGGFIILAIVGILVWGVLHFNKQHNQQNRIASADRDALQEATRERDELRKRVQVLERIVTDENTPDAKKTKQLASEIESLRRSEDQIREDQARGHKTEDMSK